MLSNITAGLHYAAFVWFSVNKVGIIRGLLYGGIAESLFKSG